MLRMLRLFAKQALLLVTLLALLIAGCAIRNACRSFAAVPLTALMILMVMTMLLLTAPRHRACPLVALLILIEGLRVHDNACFVAIATLLVYTLFWYIWSGFCSLVCC